MEKVKLEDSNYKFIKEVQGQIILQIKNEPNSFEVWAPTQILSGENAAYVIVINGIEYEYLKPYIKDFF